MVDGKSQVANVATTPPVLVPSIKSPAELSEHLLDYSVRVVRVVESLPHTLAGRRIADQLLRATVSVGAHYEEASAAESREDFVHKLQIGLKELRESNYCSRSSCI